MVILCLFWGVVSGGVRIIFGGIVGIVGYMNVMKYDVKFGWVGMKCV